MLLKMQDYSQNILANKTVEPGRRSRAVLLNHQLSVRSWRLESLVEGPAPGEPQLTHSAVAFSDILGVQEAETNGTAQRLFEKLHAEYVLQACNPYVFQMD